MLKTNLDAAKNVPLPVGLKIRLNRLRRKIHEAFKPLFQTELTKRVASMLEALPQTNPIKSIVTANMPMDLERKG